MQDKRREQKFARTEALGQWKEGDRKQSPEGRFQRAKRLLLILKDASHLHTICTEIHKTVVLIIRAELRPFWGCWYCFRILVESDQVF